MLATFSMVNTFSPINYQEFHQQQVHGFKIETGRVQKTKMPMHAYPIGTEKRIVDNLADLFSIQWGEEICGSKAHTSPPPTHTHTHTHAPNSIPMKGYKFPNTQYHLLICKAWVWDTIIKNCLQMIKINGTILSMMTQADLMAFSSLKNP